MPTAAAKPDSASALAPMSPLVRDPSDMPPPNGSRLSCGAARFKRLLGRNVIRRPDGILELQLNLGALGYGAQLGQGAQTPGGSRKLLGGVGRGECDGSHSGGPSGLEARRCVLHDDAIRRWDSEPSRSREVALGIRLAVREVLGSDQDQWLREACVSEGQ